MSDAVSAFDAVLAAGRDNDPSCRERLAAFTDPELVGELLTALYRTPTPQARAALWTGLRNPFRRGYWQGFKRIFKLAEADFDVALLAHQIHALDDASSAYPASFRTLGYMRRRMYRHLKAVAVRERAARGAGSWTASDRIGWVREAEACVPGVLDHAEHAWLLTREELDAALESAKRGEAGSARAKVAERADQWAERLREVQAGAGLVEYLELLLPKYSGEEVGEVLTRVLRRTAAAGWQFGDGEDGSAFVARLDNPFAADREPDDDLGALGALLDLDDEALLKPKDTSTATPSAPTPGRTGWAGPIFWELWVDDTERLVGVLETVRHEGAAEAIGRLLRERAGDRLGEVALDRFYALLRHPCGSVWRLGLSQLAARAKQERLRFAELIPLMDRAQQDGPDWRVIADLLYVFDDEHAASERPALAAPLKTLLVDHTEAAGVGPVVTFLRRHLSDQLGPPDFDWPAALALCEARRPDVRELGRDVARRLAADGGPAVKQLPDLINSSLAEDEPDLLHGILLGNDARPQGYVPGTVWPIDKLLKTLEGARPAGYAVLERALFAFEDRQGLHPEVARKLVAANARRQRTLGLQLFSAGLRRGTFDLLEVVGFLQSRHEDVVVWARERVEQAAAAEDLSNEALYRMLDAAAHDVQGFARQLVRDYLRNFEVAELVAFCAESPDAATADLGIQLYEEEVKHGGGEGLELSKLLPMFRILLYKVATARSEKERLYATLRRWSAEDVQNARLTVGVVAAFRRTHSKIDFSRAVRLLAEIGVRFGQEVELPFEVRGAFGATLEGQPVRG